MSELNIKDILDRTMKEDHISINRIINLIANFNFNYNSQYRVAVTNFYADKKDILSIYMNGLIKEEEEFNKSWTELKEEQEKGIITSKDFFKKAYESGCSYAIKHEGINICEDNQIKSDKYKTGITLLKKAVDMGCINAITTIGMYHPDCIDIKGHYNDVALSYFISASILGDAQAFYRIGDYYYQRQISFPKNKKETENMKQAFIHYKKAYDLGYDEEMGRGIGKIPTDIIMDCMSDLEKENANMKANLDTRKILLQVAHGQISPIFGISTTYI